MIRLLPYLIATIGIVALTFVEGIKTDRWIDHAQEQGYCASLLDEIPYQIGAWKGEDQPVDEDTQKSAGAVGYLSRLYVNEATDQRIAVWCVLGHAMNTAAHEPTICYPASGFERCQNRVFYDHELPTGETATFRTAMFEKQTLEENFSERVFWTWFLPTPEEGSNVKWDTPKDSPRYHYGNARTLYKLYFTNRLRSREEAPEDSVCLEFADAFLSVANPILQKANGPVPADFVYVKKEVEPAKPVVPVVEDAH